MLVVVIGSDWMAKFDTDKIFDKIKNQNGEDVAKLIRKNVLLGTPNIAHILKFAGRNKILIEMIIPLIKEMCETNPDSRYDTDENPIELLKQAGYNAFVVENDEQKNSIKKYYRPGEQICTFTDSFRHLEYYIIHAVKYNADKIQPSENPARDDEYGTSVISIQIAKTGGFISIKNRYNHTVENPDATFDNNPDKIIPGLSSSLKKFFGVDFEVFQGRMPSNFVLIKDQFVEYNYERNNFYFGPTYYSNGTEITELNSDYEVMLDCFILDKRNGKLRDPANIRQTNATYDILRDIFENKKITDQVNKNSKERTIFADNIKIATIKDGKITGLHLPNVKAICPEFLSWNIDSLKTISLPDADFCAKNFLINNSVLEECIAPNLKYVHDRFLPNAPLKKISFPKLESAGECFACRSNPESIDLPKLKTLGGGAFRYSQIKELFLPNLWYVPDDFLEFDTELETLSLPNATRISDHGALDSCEKISAIYTPKMSAKDSKVLHKLYFTVAQNRARQQESKKSRERNNVFRQHDMLG